MSNQDNHDDDSFDLTLEVFPTSGNVSVRQVMFGYTPNILIEFTWDPDTDREGISVIATNLELEPGAIEGEITQPRVIAIALREVADLLEDVPLGQAREFNAQHE